MLPALALALALDKLLAGAPCSPARFFQRNAAATSVARPPPG
jgi:hypothetical protein